MNIKVYNQKGNVKITKTVNHRELILFSELPEGEVAEITIEVSQCTNTKKRKIKESGDNKVPDSQEITQLHKKAVTVLQFARDNQCLTEKEADRAIAVLTDDWCWDTLPSRLKEKSVGELFGRAIAVLQFASNTDVSLTSEEACSAVSALEHACD